MREIVMVPQEHISWLVDQKDSVLSIREIRRQNLAFESLLPTGMDPLHDLFIMDVVRRDLSRNLGVLQPAILEEMCKAINSTMGLEAGVWRNVCLWQSMRTIIKAISNRVLFNLPLCEDQGFLRSTETFSTCLGTGSVVAGQLVPWPLRPLIGSFFAIPIYLNMRKSFKSLLPTIERRMDDIRRSRVGQPYMDIEHNDFMTWYCVAVLKGDIAESAKTPEAIAQRLLCLVSASQHGL